MAVVTKTATGLPNLTAARPKRADARSNHGRVRTSCFSDTITNGDSIASTFEMARIPSHAIIKKSSRIYSGGVAGATNVDIGVAGAPACIAAALNITAAGQQDCAGAIGIGSVEKALWEIAGMASDPNKELSVYLTLNTAATGTGLVALDLAYITD